MGAIAILLLAAGAVSFFLWGTGSGNTAVTLTNDKSPMRSLRLSTDLHPIWYNLSVTAYVPGFIAFDDPAKNQKFEANVTIKIHVDKPTDRIELNARELNFTAISVTADNGDTIEVSNIDIRANFTKVVINLNTQLAVNQDYYVWITYSGNIGDRNFGLYSSSYDTSDGNTRYLATTQMEPTGARLMVPCFDEPSFKAIWRVRVIHPKGTNAISNALEEEQNRPITDDGNWLLTQFGDTPKMSSYLFALVISDFQYKEAVMQSIDGKNIRVRVWLRFDIIDLGVWALESSQGILALFERRFEVPFPIPKMDLVGVRDFPAGAMENFGLVIFLERTLLYNSAKSDIRRKMGVTSIIAHEFAHQWFGDIVTLNWWSNLFLNEGFAAFMENTALAGLLNTSTTERAFEYLNYQIWGFWSDQLSTAHPLNYEFLGPEELGSIFDGIAYGKGSSILHMIENVIGSEVFYNGIRIYLKRHKFGNAHYKDLLKALDEAMQTNGANKGISVTEFAENWVTQPNHPVVVATRVDDTRVSLTQMPFILDYGINGEKVKRAWKIPIWYQVNGKEQDLLWLGDQSITLENVGKDDLLIINPQSIGFYYVKYDVNLIARIKKELLSNLTNIAPILRGRLLDDIFWQAHAGYLTYEEAFNLTTYLPGESNGLPWMFVMEHLDIISDHFNDEPESKIVDEFISLMSNMRTNAESLSQLFEHTRILPENKLSLLPFTTSHEDYDYYLNKTELLPRPKHLMRFFDMFTRHYPTKLASESGLETWLKIFREQFLEQCSSASAMSSQCSKVPKNIRSYVYCLGVKYEIVDFDSMTAMYEREIEKKEKSRILNSLCCTENVVAMKRLLRAAVDENSKPNIPVIYADDVLISVAWNSQIGSYIAFDFFLENWQLIYYKFINEVGFGTLNDIIRNCLSDSTPRGIKTLESFMDDQSNDLHSVQQFNRQLTYLKTRRHWIEKNLKQLTNYFAVQIAKAKENQKKV